MSLLVASWNIEGRLSNNDVSSRSTPLGIVKSIENLHADILVLLEAHSQNSLEDLEVKKQLKDLGYKFYSVAYEDDMASRSDAFYKKLSLMLLSKLPIKKFEIIRLGNFRNTLTAIVHDDKNGIDLRVIGVHLDDRSEDTRLKQIKDLTKIVDSSKMPTIVMGDFNSMHGKDLWPSKFLRSKVARLLAKPLPPLLVSKAFGMARGEGLDFLQANTNLVDADPKHQPTATPKMRGREWFPSIRLIQIDHIFVSPDIKVKKFQIAPDGGADHRAISTNIDL